MAKEHEVQRLSTTKRFLDRALDPPQYVDEELPTVTKLLLPALRRASARLPLGTIPGSFYVTGSHYDTGPGTYSLRVTRVSLGLDGTNIRSGTVYNWYIRHSRTGTYDIIPFSSKTRITLQGDSMKPVYSFGPGTVIFGFTGQDHLGVVGTHMTIYQTLEGIVGRKEPLK